MKENPFKKELELLDELEWNFTKASLNEDKESLPTLVNTLKELDKSVREKLEKIEKIKDDLSKGVAIDLKDIDIDVPALLKEALGMSVDNNSKTDLSNLINELKKELNKDKGLQNEELSKILEKVNGLRFFVLRTLYEEQVQSYFERQLKFKYSIISIIITFLSLIVNVIKHIQMTYFESMAISILIGLYFYEINNIDEDKIKRKISEIDKRIKGLYEAKKVNKNV